MPRPLPPLPEGFSWYRRRDGAGELKLWGVNEVASVEPLPDGRWLVRVNNTFHESTHREAIAPSKGLACFWIHRWAEREAYHLYSIRPRVPSLGEAMGCPVSVKKSEGVSIDRNRLDPPWPPLKRTRRRRR